MPDIMCSLPMQIGIKITIDPETNKPTGWEILQHSVDEVNEFLLKIEYQLTAAMNAVGDIDPATVDDPSKGIFMIDENGEVKSLEDVKEEVMNEMLNDPDTPETKH